MEPRPPKRKKYCKGEPGQPFPIIQTISGPYKFTGRFNGFSVIVEKPSEMEKVNSMGSFGKGTLSRNFPNYNKKELEILRQRQYDNRKKILVKYPGAYKNFEERRVIVLEDSDSENEDYIKNLKPLLQKQKVPVVETLNLFLEEAYFLMNVKECLKIKDVDDNLLDSDAAWTLFSNTQETFIQNYVVYNFFRNRNWVVKSGLKFGGDYLLYKDGPAFYHASYLVIIDVIKSETGERHENICKRSTNWISLICLNRLTETAAKELLICQVIWPQSLTIDDAKMSNRCFQDFTVKPVLMKRWVSKAERKNYISPNSKRSSKIIEENIDTTVNKKRKRNINEVIPSSTKNHEQDNCSANDTNRDQNINTLMEGNIKKVELNQNVQDFISVNKICDKTVTGSNELTLKRDSAILTKKIDTVEESQKRKLSYSEREENKIKKS